MIGLGIYYYRNFWEILIEYLFCFYKECFVNLNCKVFFITDIFFNVRDKIEIRLLFFLVKLIE